MYGMPDLHGNLFMGTLWSEYHKAISYLGGGGLAKDSDYPGVSRMQRTRMRTFLPKRCPDMGKLDSIGQGSL